MSETRPPYRTGNTAPTAPPAQWAIDQVNAQRHFWPEAALQRAIDTAGLTPLTLEFRATDKSGITWALQGARSDNDTQRSVFAAPITDYNAITQTTYPGPNAPAPTPTLGKFAGLTIRPPVSPPFNFTQLQQFDAPRAYANKLHEGLDFAVEIGTTVAAVAAGTIDAIGNSPAGYGVYIRMRHTYRGNPWYSWYGHLTTTLRAVGDNVRAGTAIARSGNTGNSTGPHLHLSIGLPGAGLPGYAIPDAIDPLTILDIAQSGQLPKLYNIWDYITGGGQETIYELRHADGSQERVQVQMDGPNKCYIVKGETAGHYETLWLFNGAIVRGRDTSPGRGRFYEVAEAGIPSGARWCAQFMAIGDEFTNAGHQVQFYNSADCSPSAENSGFASNYLKFTAHYETWRSPAGIEIPNVIELAGLHERWLFAETPGMVEWQAAWGHSFASEIHAPGARPRLNREIINCL